ncbi:PorP/SprF family type IX secretion system membrane protein [Hymenobacter sp. DG25A]|uniref:PorP/SprF family type IX secretion system membrane protein n=1 Tax=Hymenobacter sp. DG25A TaxID=1385663 RepID=UPI000A90C386|nr:PorP/SprF family type IX secretion system membrane protein [Hymenobacter sp. DG25A]
MRFPLLVRPGFPGRRLAAWLGAGLLLLGAKEQAKAQDLYFSQSYATRLHLNPAFTGLQHDYGISLAYREQFPSLAGSFQTTHLGADYRFEKQRNAVGLLVNMDRLGAVGYTRLEAAALYAYHARLSEDVHLSAGAQLTYGSQRISYSNLVFGDQLSDDGLLTGASAEPVPFDPVHYLSGGVGGLLYNRQAWAGLALYHLNQPNLGNQAQGRLPLRATFTGGVKHFFSESTVKQSYREISVSPTVSYTHQGASQRAEAGLYGTVTPITMGLLYRGIPLPGAPRPASVLAVVAGVQLTGFRVGYSHDVELGSRNLGAGGAHEIVLVLEQVDMLAAARRRISRKNYRLLPCPAF